MNRHILFDRVMLWTFRQLGTPFFTSSILSPTFEQHLPNVRVDSDDITRQGYQEFDVTSLAGPVKLKIHVLHPLRSGAPLVIYNMGGGEAPFDSTITRAYPASESTGVNVVAVEAPYQRSRRQIGEAFVHLNTYLAMLAITVRMNELIVQSETFRDCPIKIVAGTSLGGFVSNRHHLAYNSADGYVPFVAGTRHGDIFLTTIRASTLVTENPDYIRERLNFDREWVSRPHPNVFPQLGRYDQLNQYKIQAPSYGPDVDIEVWNGGHLYHVIHPQLIRNKLDGTIAALSRNGNRPP